MDATHISSDYTYIHFSFVDLTPDYKVVMSDPLVEVRALQEALVSETYCSVWWLDLLYRTRYLHDIKNRNRTGECRDAGK